MKKIISIVMAVFVIFAMVNCDNGTTSGGPKEIPPGKSVIITYNANGWESSEMPGPTEGISGEVIGRTPLNPLSNGEQRFLGWSLTSGQAGEPVTQDYVLTKNITLYVLWVIDGTPITITYNANGWEGAGVPTTPRNTSSGERVTADNLPTLTNTATQVFVGWSATPGQEGSRLLASYILRTNTTLYVLWRDPVTLAFDYNYTGSPAAPASVIVAQNTAIGDVLPPVADSENPIEGLEPVRTNWIFNGWFTANTGGTKVTASSTFETSTTLYAQWGAMPNWAWINLDLTMQPVMETVNNPWPTSVAKTEFNSDGELVWTFSESMQRGILLFSPAQRAILDKIDSYRLVIDGVASEDAGNFRWFIGWMGTTNSWNGDGGSGEGQFDGLRDRTITFGANKTLDGSQDGGAGAGTQDTRTGAWIIQYRVSEPTATLTIKSVKIRYDGDIGGSAPAADTAIKISFDRNYTGAPIGPNPLIIDKGGKINDVYFPKPDPLPVVTRALNSFDGWYTEKEGGTKVEPTTTFNASTTLYAHWESLPVITITYDLNYTTDNDPPDPIELVKGVGIGAANLPSPARIGHAFTGWSKEKEGGTTNAVNAATTFDADTTIYAQWETSSLKYTVTFDGGYGATAVDAGKVENVVINDSVGTSMPTDPTRANYTFKGWYTGWNGSGTQFKADTPVAANITVYALWEAATDEPIELVNRTLTGWDTTESALVLEKTGGFSANNTRANIVDLPIPSFMDASKYYILVIEVDIYKDGTLCTPATDRFSNDITYWLFNGAGAAAGDGGYNGGDITVFSWTVASKNIDYSGGRGYVQVAAMSKANPSFDKIVIKSVKFTVAE